MCAYNNQTNRIIFVFHKDLFKRLKFHKLMKLYSRTPIYIGAEG